MKSTNPVLSAVPSVNGMPMTSNCLPYQPPSSVVVAAPSENGHASSKEQTDASLRTKSRVQKDGESPKNNGWSNTAFQRRTTNGSHNLNGRSNLRPSHLTGPSVQSPQVHKVHHFASPTLESVFGTNVLDKQEPSLATLVDLPHMAPILASSHAMETCLDAIFETADGKDTPPSLSMRETTKSLSSLLLSDFVHAWVRHGLPRKYLSRSIRRYWLKRQLGTIAIPQHRRRTMTVCAKLTQVRGIPNLGGQSCFLNSVLQALASLSPFLVYLERIVQLQHQQEELDETLFGKRRRKKESLAECLLMNLNHLNGSAAEQQHLDPREVLYRVSKEHAQFRPRHGGLGRIHHVGTEQQDAQELLQALLGMVIADAGLDSSCYTTKESEQVGVVVTTPLDFSSSDIVEEQDSVLSLSSFLTRMDMEQQEDGKDVHAESNGNNHLPREEKKQEDFELAAATETELKEKSPSKNRSQEEWTTRQKQSPHLSASTLNMLKTLSPMTPSPLSGWIGSTLQCCTCHHVHPIQNAPFLDIPIVPTSVSKYLSSSGTRIVKSSSPPPACTLNQCLRDFTSVERVEDVECRACTIQREAALLEEEIFMLRGAVETISARLQKTHGGDDQVKVMRSELKAAEARYARMLRLDPDGEADEILDGRSLYLEDGSDILEGQQRPLIRGEAKKCLLLTRMPSVLCLHVQRRYYDPTRNHMAKTLQHVDFPEILDLGLHCAYAAGGLTGRGNANKSDNNRKHKPIPYKLMSIIEHRGNAHAGHYQTYRRAPPNSRREWVLVSDLSVTPLHWKDVKNCQAYMLFYEAI